MKAVLVIPAGGEGRRMNGDKPLRLLGERTLLERAVGYGKAQGLPIALSLRTEGQFPSASEIPVIADRTDIEGPLAGIVAGLTWALKNGFDAMLTIPVDMPWLPDDLCHRLQTDFAGSPLVARSDERQHPVCSLWPVTALDAVERYAERGERSLRGILQELGAHTIEWPIWERDPFANINDPDALAEAERFLQKSR